MAAPKHLPAFARRRRRATSSPELDRFEEEWWNRNAGLMQRVWTLPSQISEALRRPVLEEAGRFLGEGVILEPGCGEGWPGRLLMRSHAGLRIVGTDISAEQLELARTNAAAEGLERRTRYRRAEMHDLDLGEFDGAFVHAALHHLADDEVARFLDVLAAGPAGFRIVLYEPVFTPDVSWLPRRGAAAICGALAKLRVRLLPRGLQYDEDLTRALHSLEAEAERNGWFLSPKEVPFQHDALLAELDRRFDIAFARPVHFDAIEIAQRLASSSDARRMEPSVDRVLTRALWFDRAVLRSGLYRACRGRYAFWLFGVVVGGVSTSER